MKLTVLLFALFAACASAFSPSASFGPSPMGVARISTGPTMMAAKGGRPNPLNPDGSFNVAFREWEFQQKQRAREPERIHSHRCPRKARGRTKNYSLLSKSCRTGFQEQQKVSRRSIDAFQ